MLLLNKNKYKIATFINALVISVNLNTKVLAANSDITSSGKTLAQAGISSLVVIVVGIVLLVSLIVILSILFRDYKKHKKPLTEIDPNVNYSFMHHIRVVTIPLFKYRLSIKVTKANPMDPNGVHKF